MNNTREFQTPTPFQICLFGYVNNQRHRLKNVKEEKGMTQVKYPCKNCVYFDVCGSNTRTKKCEGRKTKTEKKKENN